jgi:hypothetical protein
MADKGRTAIDLDTSCVAVSAQGRILVEATPRILTVHHIWLH